MNDENKPLWPWQQHMTLFNYGQGGSKHSQRQDGCSLAGCSLACIEVTTEKHLFLLLSSPWARVEQSD
jgi:hypothetical protein